MNPYTIIITHFISDWWLQPRTAAENKTSSFWWMLAHVFIVFVSFFLVTTVMFGYVEVGSKAVEEKMFYHYTYMAFLNALAHFFIDSSLWGYFKAYVLRQPKEYLDKNMYAKDWWFYFTIGLDQMLHLCVAFYLFRPI